MNAALLKLIVCQGFFMINNVTFIAVNGLVGLALAPTAWMATLPVTGFVLGAAVCAPIVARIQRALGRKRCFQLGLVAAAASTLVCAAATVLGSFWLLVAGTLIAGFYNANAALYRFAAAELVSPDFREKAISWVLAGGIAGAVVGPQLAVGMRDTLPQPFAGAYAALAAVSVLALLVVSRIDFPPLPEPPPAQPGRSMRELARQPVFVVAVAAAALGYGVMSLLMSATPIAMSHASHDFGHAALVIEWHVLGMFVPSFFTGHLVKRFGPVAVMAAGFALNLACIAVALSGTDLSRFLIALVTLGVGWNFLFIGGTTLLTRAYRPHEKTTAQGAMDFCVFSTMALSSFGAGALVTSGGWTWLNLGSLALLLVAGTALGWFALRLRVPKVPAA